MTLDGPDLARMAPQLSEPLYGPQELAIIGGTCAERDLSAFLASWNRDLPYRIWEETDSSHFQENTWPARIDRLERGRLFGPGGDLEVRREADRFLWRFIGPPGDISLPAGCKAADFWTIPEHRKVRFFKRPQQFLLWGDTRGENGLWHDNRVGFATLDYPHPLKSAAGTAPKRVSPPRGERIRLIADSFSRDGHVEFIWFKKLEGYHGDRNR